ncbi:hypothetical protein [Microbacterium indicum]|uniref:phosphotriesterase family protein n=1 Tax=Microbacterium indicum TaxID=358100 RepID=UPI00040A6E2D|nr:hypothetical protein [Microbacterium indicum]
MIETVLGPVPREALGRVNTNEHVLGDSRVLAKPNREGRWIEGEIRPEILGDLRWSYQALPDNLLLDDVGTAISELALAAESGVGTIVEATSWGMGPRHADLPAVSRAAGLHIVSAYGVYIDRTLDDAWRQKREPEFEALFRAALHDRVPGTEFRAGLLGLMGTSAEITPAEDRALRTACHVAAEAGAAVSVRLEGHAMLGLEVAELMMSEGLPADKILFCNIDKVLDDAYVRDIVDTGAVVEFAFGSEHYFADRFRDATDLARLEFLLDLVHERPRAAITATASVWTKGQLARYGGMGYGHVPRRIAPALARMGLESTRIDDILVHRPAALLDRPEGTR